MIEGERNKKLTIRVSEDDHERITVGALRRKTRGKVQGFLEHAADLLLAVYPVDGYRAPTDAEKKFLADALLLHRAAQQGDEAAAATVAGIPPMAARIRHSLEAAATKKSVRSKTVS